MKTNNAMIALFGCLAFALSGALAAQDVGSSEDAAKDLDAGAASAAWWNWFEAHPVVADESGAVNCGRGQTGSTWFLAGTNGQPELIGASRECILPIPRGTRLFFPNVTVAVTYDDGSSTVPAKRVEADSYLTEFAHGIGGGSARACGIVTTYDGVSGPAAGLETVRVQSPVFPLFGDPEAIADGYWTTVLATPGVHHLRIQGSLYDPQSGDYLFEVDMTYVYQVR